MRRVIEVGILTPPQPQPHKCVHWVPIYASIINLRTRLQVQQLWQSEWPGNEFTSVEVTAITIIQSSIPCLRNMDQQEANYWGTTEKYPNQEREQNSSSYCPSAAWTSLQFYAPSHQPRCLAHLFWRLDHQVERSGSEAAAQNASIKIFERQTYSNWHYTE